MSELENGGPRGFPTISLDSVRCTTYLRRDNSIARVRIHGKWISVASEEYKKYNASVWKGYGWTDLNRLRTYERVRGGVYEDIFTCDK